jgi:hypothetical protein
VRFSHIGYKHEIPLAIMLCHMLMASRDHRNETFKLSVDSSVSTMERPLIPDGRYEHYARLPSEGHFQTPRL